MQQRLKILAISGSLRTDSSNTSILKHLQKSVPQHDFDIYNGLDKLPHFNPVLDNEEPPVEVKQLRELLAQADGIIICTPEYAFGIPGSLKNMIDWTVSSSSLVDKKIALITASSMGDTAHAAMLKILEALTGKTIGNTTLLIPYIRSKMNAENEIIDVKTEQDIQNVLKALLASIS